LFQYNLNHLQAAHKHTEKEEICLLFYYLDRDLFSCVPHATFVIRTLNKTDDMRVT